MNLEAHSGVPKHDAIVNYRDAQVPVMVHSVMDEYNMHVTALEHGAAVDAGAMGSLGCEAISFRPGCQWSR